MDCCVFLQVVSCYFRFDQLAHPEIAGEPYLFNGNGGILPRDHTVDIQIILFITNTWVCAYIHSNDTITSFSLTTILHSSTHKRISEYIAYISTDKPQTNQISLSKQYLMDIEIDLPRGRSTSLSTNSSRGISINSATSSMAYTERVQAQSEKLTWAEQVENGETQEVSLWKLHLGSRQTTLCIHLMQMRQLLLKAWNLRSFHIRQINQQTHRW